METKLNILLIDDSEDDTFFFKRMVTHAAINAKVSSALDGEAGLAQVSNQQFDCIFLDYNLPVMDGLHVLRRIRGIGVDTPIVMLTGQKDEHTIVKLMQEGATDYLTKNTLTDESLRLSIENSQRLYQIKREKQLAEEALRISEARLAEAQRIAHIGNWEYNLSDRTLFLSEEAQNILENDPAAYMPTLLELSGKIHTGDQSIVEDCVTNLSKKSDFDVNIRVYARDGSIKYLNIKCRVCYGEGKLCEGLIGTVQDITLLKNALTATKKATIKSKATTIVMGIAIFLFLISEAILDPFIDSITASLMVSLSCKGSIAVALKPLEFLLERVMLKKITLV